MVVYFGLGSNLGDRSANLSEAVRRLGEAFSLPPLGVSDYIRTLAWGFDGAEFMNAAVAFDIPDPDPLGILAVCKDIERQMGRTGQPEYDGNGNRIYRDRVIDIDILLIGDMKVDLPELKVPHPLMYRRDFVMRPLNQLMEII